MRIIVYSTKRLLHKLTYLFLIVPHSLINHPPVGLACSFIRAAPVQGRYGTFLSIEGSVIDRDSIECYLVLEHSPYFHLSASAMI